MFTATDPAVIIVAYAGRSGHHNYDRGIRDHMSDAHWAMPGGDVKGRGYWTWRALTLAHLTLMGARYGASAEQFDAAQLAALETMRTVGVAPEAIAYAASALRIAA